MKPNMLLAVYFIKKFAIILIALSAAACSTVRRVDSEVLALSRLDSPVAPVASWRFERLLSQQNLNPEAAKRQALLETSVAQTLASKGFAGQAGGADSTYSVQIIHRIARVDLPGWDDSPLGFGLPARDYLVTRSGALVPLPRAPHHETPWWLYEITLLVRDKSGLVVYETRARHRSRFSNDTVIVPALVQAGMDSFPKPSEGVRWVHIDVAEKKEAEKK
jgi:hypothetical protein